MESKLLLSYNIPAETQEEYLRFMINDFVPILSSLGLKNAGVWETAYGNYPIRLLVFVSESAKEMERALQSDKFVEMEKRLAKYVTDYTRRVVPFDARFQF